MDRHYADIHGRGAEPSPKLRRKLRLSGAVSLALALVAVNMALQTYLNLSNEQYVPGLPMMSLDNEQNVPALFSTLLLFAAAPILAYIAARDRKDGGRDAAKWAVLACGFLLMGVDESLSLHERMIDPLRALLGRSFDLDRLGIFYFAWVIPGIILVAGLAVYFLPFMSRLPRRTGIMLFVAAAIYLGGAIGVELVEGWWREGHGHRNVMYHAMVSLEEGLEMIGVIILIHTLLDFISTQYGQVSITVLSPRHATAGADDPAKESPSGPVLRPSGIRQAPRGSATW